MATRFSPVRGRPGSVAVTLDAVEVDVLRGLVEELLALLTDDEPADAAPGADVPPEAAELAAMVGIGTATTLPDDPVLARLFPNGYTDDDEASADFRRYTEPALRDRKRANAGTMLQTLAAGGGKIVLAPEQALAWLGALNDLRLALGTRAEIEEDWEERVDALPEDDPRRYILALYDLLSWLQETLVRSLD